MLEIHTTQRLDQIEVSLRLAAERHGGGVLAVSHIGQLLKEDKHPEDVDALTFTVCFPDLYASLLHADVRFAAFLPGRIAACAWKDGAFLEAISPKEYCRMLHRPEIEPLAVMLEDRIRVVMEEAAGKRTFVAGAGGVTVEHRATEDMINMRAALPQRIDCLGTKVEELAGTGEHDSPGG
jgi:uncharacterized protein (DUF302 family)